jgi:hypothetical protein
MMCTSAVRRFFWKLLVNVLNSSLGQFVVYECGVMSDTLSFRGFELLENFGCAISQLAELLVFKW